MRVGQRQGLIGELFGHPTGINHFVGSKLQYREGRQLFDKPQKLDGSPLIVPAENQPWPSAITNPDVTIGGGSENNP
jgi:hypothetical protein